VRATWRPLAAWPYPPKPSQTDRFQSTWTSSLDLLEREIDKLDGREVIIGVVTEERYLRLDGQLRADAKYGHPGVEISFEVPVGPPSGGWRRLVFHTDAYPYLASNLRAIALGLAALRAVDRYGITSTAEQYAGFAQLTAGGADPERGKLLVDRAGSVAKALHDHHPDHGGQDRDFIDVQAYRKLAGSGAR
jgi:hypothetical protein